MTMFYCQLNTECEYNGVWRGMTACKMHLQPPCGARWSRRDYINKDGSIAQKNVLMAITVEEWESLIVKSGRMKSKLMLKGD